MFKRYVAFLSYSHCDEDIAKWLLRRLESYRIPRGVAPGFGVQDLFGRRIGTIFRDREELPAGSPLTAAIKEALADSDALIVLCSPAAALSEWVDKEIAEFLRLGQGRVFPVIVAGVPGESVYPPSLVGEREGLAADLRDGKDGRDYGAIKLLAGLLGVGANDLARREAKARRRRLALASAVVAAFVLLVGVTLWFGDLARERQRAATDARNLQFAQNGWNAYNRGSYLLAARYALAGMRLSPANREEYRTLLGAAYHKAGNAILNLDGPEDIYDVEFSRDGRWLLALARPGRAILYDIDARRRVARLDGRAIHSGGSFSPDGRLVLTMTDENRNSVFLRDAASGATLCRIAQPDGHISTAAFTPSGSQVVAVGDRGVLIVDSARCAVHKIDPFGAGGFIDIQSIEEDGLILSHEGSFAFIDYSGRQRFRRDYPGRNVDTAARIGDRIVVVTRSDQPGGKIDIYDLQGNHRASPQVPRRDMPDWVEGEDLMDDIFPHPDDGTISVSSLAGCALFAVADGRLLALLPTHGPPDPNAAQDGDLLLNVISPVETYDLMPGGCDRTRAGGQGRPDGPDYSGRPIDPAMLRFKSGENGVGIWHAQSGRALGRLAGPVMPFREVRADPSVRYVAGVAEGYARVWDTAFVAPFPGAGEGQALSPDLRRLVTARSKRLALLWDVQRRRVLASIPMEQGDFARALFSDDGRRLLIMSNARPDLDWAPASPEEIAGQSHPPPVGEAILLDAGTGQTIARLDGHKARVYAAAFSSDGRLLATLGLDGAAILWDSNTGSALRRFAASERIPHRPYGTFGDKTRFSRDGRLLLTVSCCNPYDLKVWDVRRGRLVLAARTETISVANFSDDGGFLVSDSSRGADLVVDDLRTGRRVGRLVIEDWPELRLPSPDFGTALVAGYTDPPKLWDVRSGAPLRALAGADGANAGAFSSDGRLVATALHRDVRVWEVSSGRQLAHMKGHLGKVVSLQFSDDRSRLITLAEDLSARVWDTRDGRELAVVTSTDVDSLLFAHRGWRAAIGARLAPPDAALDYFGRKTLANTLLTDISRLLQPWDSLQPDACHFLLDAPGRRFSKAEIAADQLLQAEWSDPDRDVCEGVPAPPGRGRIVRASHYISSSSRP